MILPIQKLGVDFIKIGSQERVRVNRRSHLRNVRRNVFFLTEGFVLIFAHRVVSTSVVVFDIRKAVGEKSKERNTNHQHRRNTPDKGNKFLVACHPFQAFGLIFGEEWEGSHIVIVTKEILSAKDKEGIICVDRYASFLARTLNVNDPIANIVVFLAS